MTKKTETPTRSVDAIARGIIADIFTIQTSCQSWQDAEQAIVNIQRSARMLLGHEQIVCSRIMPAAAYPTVEEKIAEGYRLEAERQLEAAAGTVSLLDVDAMRSPRNLQICLMAMNLAASTLHKYTRAAQAAGLAGDVALAEKELGISDNLGGGNHVPLTPRRAGTELSPALSREGRGGALEVDYHKEAANG